MEDLHEWVQDYEAMNLQKQVHNGTSPRSPGAGNASEIALQEQTCVERDHHHQPHDLNHRENCSYKRLEPGIRNKIRNVQKKKERERESCTTVKRNYILLTG